MFAHRPSEFPSVLLVALLLGGSALLAALFAFAASAPLAQGADGPIVRVTGGLVQGRLVPAPGGAVFKGIPYAAPPVGDLRWRETQPIRPWAGVRQAGEFGPACLQILAPDASNEAVAATSSEDCLSLNVFAPEWPPAASRPVMMWIHGGGYNGQSARGGATYPLIANEPPFDGTRLASLGVVVVTIEYRVGLLSAMGHPELSAESPHRASGNYGVLDQIVALAWIRDNIVRFGGDPTRVTVFGQSGGARYGAFLLTSPLARGLIHRAIFQSNSNTDGPARFLTPAEFEQTGVILAQVLNAPSTGAIRFLRSLPASEIVAARPEVGRRMNELRQGLDGIYHGVDGYVIPRSQLEVYGSGDEAPVPMIVGSNALDTGRPGTRRVNGGRPDGPRDEMLAWMRDGLESFYGAYPDLLDRAMTIYGLAGPSNDLSTYPPYGTIADQMGVDLNHRCGSATAAAWHSRIAPSWLYEFTRTSPRHPPWHNAELRFVWGDLLDEESDPSARSLSTVMQQYWTNFAKTGDPNGPGLPAWPKYDVTSRPSMEFSSEGAVQKAAVRAAPCRVYLDKYTRDFNALPKR